MHVYGSAAWVGKEEEGLAEDEGRGKKRTSVVREFMLAWGWKGTWWELAYNAQLGHARARWWDEASWWSVGQVAWFMALIF
jgi:hypothetical protein